MSWLDRIALETWTLLRNYKLYYVFNFYYQDPLNFANVSIFFLQKVIIFWQEQYLYWKQ